jgi:hypothetical protein
MKKWNNWLNSKKGFLLLLVTLFVSAAFGQLEQMTKPSQGLISRLIEIKYSSELYLSSHLKKDNSSQGEKDSALAVYNTLRTKLDGFVYQLSSDMIAANSPRKMRLLNAWCLAQSEALNRKIIPPPTILNYTQLLYEINALYNNEIVAPNFPQSKTINLTTNVFYLFKDSYTIIQGLSDLKTQKTMALIEVLDHTRLLSPGEVAKAGKL